MQPWSRYQEQNTVCPRIICDSLLPLTDLNKQNRNILKVFWPHNENEDVRDHTTGSVPGLFEPWQLTTTGRNYMKAYEPAETNLYLRLELSNFTWQNYYN